MASLASERLLALLQQGIPLCKRPFEALADEPALYEFIPDKTALLEADSALWAGLIAEHPEFAHEYPLANMDEVDEIGQILLHQPQLVWYFTWNEDNLPVKLFITNENPEPVP